MWGNVSDFALRRKCLTRRVSEISLPLVTTLTRQTPVLPNAIDALALLGLVLVILLGLVLIAGGGPPLH